MPRRSPVVVLCVLGTGLAIAAPAAAAAGAATADVDADGRIDVVTLGPTTARVPLTVTGWRTTAVERDARRTRVRLAERARTDTSARPWVRVGARRIRARDAAPPVAGCARLTDRDGDGRADRLALRVSEPVSFPGTARGSRVLAVAGARVGRVAAVRRGRTVVASLVGGDARVKRCARARVLPGARRIVDAAGLGLRTAAATRAPAPAAGDRDARAATPARGATTTGTAPVPATATGDRVGAGDGDGDGGWQRLERPIDPAQLTGVPFGTRSHWLQPWRAYLDTPPAAALRDALGINFNVPAAHADAAAALLAASGFRRARLEIGWGDMAYADPTQPADPAGVRARLAALQRHGLRPLLLLNANDGAPTPRRRFSARVTAAAPAGARQLQVDAATAAELRAGPAGFDGPTGKAAEFLAVSVDAAGVVTLSKPLPMDVPAGTYPASALQHLPFAPPQTATGEANPAFEATLAGWLRYVEAISREAKAVFGAGGFDVEVWNEMTFGADFLDPRRYFDPVPDALTGRGDVERAILERTVAWFRDPANGMTAVRVGDGFANQTPFASGATSPPGLAALDKHPYHAGVKAFPAATVPNDVRPVDALGRPEGARDALGRWRDAFVPAYRAFFPEYYLSAIQTETLVRDLAPQTTMVGDVPHGRATLPPGATTPPELWVTETGIDPLGSDLPTVADVRHLQAKATLRTLASFVNKGVAAVHFYAVAGDVFGLVDGASPDGGETMAALRRMTAAFAGPESPSPRRALRLEAIADRHDHRQFDGDGTAAHPPLRNREVVAFLPFQADAGRFVVPAYVMTRDMGRVQRPELPVGDVRRHDLRPETYRLTVGGLRAGRLRASATDPLTGAVVPVRIVARETDSAVLEVELTDAPRLLVLEDG